MVDTHLDLQLLQAHLVRCRSKVINISVAQIVGFTEKPCFLLNNGLRKLVELLIGISETSCIQHVVVVAPAVEANEFHSKERSNFFVGRVDHSVDRLSFSCYFPVDEKQVREDLTVEKYHFPVIDFYRVGRFVRFEFHLIRQRNAIARIIRALRSKLKYDISHIGDIIMQPAGVSILQNLIDEVYTWFGRWMYLFVQIAQYHNSETALRLYYVGIDHFLLSLQR